MDLDFNHSDAHWSYGGFGNFRRRLANKIGINLSAMKGFGGDISFETIKDNIEPFLNHSDCDGILTVEECEKVAPRLKELVNK